MAATNVLGAAFTAASPEKILEVLSDAGAWRTFYGTAAAALDLRVGGSVAFEGAEGARQITAFSVQPAQLLLVLSSPWTEESFLIRTGNERTEIQCGIGLKNGAALSREGAQQQRTAMEQRAAALGRLGEEKCRAEWPPCPTCGAPADPAFRFCESCGAPLGKSPVEPAPAVVPPSPVVISEPVAAPAPAAAPKPVAAPAPAPEPAGRRCPTCGAILLDSDKFCPTCGKPAPATEPTPAVVPPAPVVIPEPVAAPKPVTTPKPVAAPAPAPVARQPKSPKAQKPQKTVKTWMIIVAAGLLALALIGGFLVGFFALGNSPAKESAVYADAEENETEAPVSDDATAPDDNTAPAEEQKTTEKETPLAYFPIRSSDARRLTEGLCSVPYGTDIVFFINNVSDGSVQFNSPPDNLLYYEISYAHTGDSDALVELVVVCADGTTATHSAQVSPTDESVLSAVIKAPANGPYELKLYVNGELVLVSNLD